MDYTSNIVSFDKTKSIYLCTIVFAEEVTGRRKIFDNSINYWINITQICKGVFGWYITLHVQAVLNWCAIIVLQFFLESKFKKNELF